MSTQLEEGSEPKKPVVSPHKARANRQNALKSTGPRTLRGKAHSKKNALKHGLFALDPLICAMGSKETPLRYQQLLKKLTKSYQPVGIAEQLEVNRIAACWWKLDRAWRYENAEVILGNTNVTLRHLRQMSQSTISSEDQRRLVLLRRAEAEIADTDADTISAELREEMFATDPEFRRQWEILERGIKQQSSEIVARMTLQLPDPEQYAQDPACVLILTIIIAIYMIEHRTDDLAKRALEVAYDRVAVPPTEVLDRALRADAAAERNLSRAVDRLERLQRRRLGEAIPPPVSVRLTR